jgi:taurine-pyruvate aminotransferase
MHSAAKPDILTFAKGLTSAYLPLGATVTSQSVFEAFHGDESHKLTQVSTFGGHPCSCAAGLANLDIFLREKLWENAARVGAHLFEKLRAIRSPWIGDVRGRGLLAGIELVADGDRTPMAESKVIQLQKAIREAGVLVGRNNDSLPGYCNVLILSPPLTLTTEQADHIAKTIEDCLAKI